MNHEPLNIIKINFQEHVLHVASSRHWRQISGVQVFLNRSLNDFDNSGWMTGEIEKIKHLDWTAILLDISLHSSLALWQHIYCAHSGAAWAPGRHTGCIGSPGRLG